MNNDDNLKSLGDVIRPSQGAYVQGPSNGQQVEPQAIPVSGQGAYTQPPTQRVERYVDETPTYVPEPQPEYAPTEMPSIKTALDGLDARINSEEVQPTFTTTLQEDAIAQKREELGMQESEPVVEDTIMNHHTPNAMNSAQVMNAVRPNPQYVQEDADEVETTTSHKPSIRTAEVIELASVKINKMSDRDRKKRLKEVREMRKKFGMTTQTVLPLSAYAPIIGKASSMEIAQLRASSEDEYTYTHRLLSFIYSKMESTNVGKISFNDMLNMTSIYEEDILFYGLFNSTYPDENSYPLRCKKCSNDYEEVIPNQSLIAIKEDRRDQLFDLEAIRTAGYSTAKEIFENSIVGNIDRIKLPSGDIIDVRHPSLFDKLERVMKNLDATIVEKKAEAASIAVYVDRVLIADPDSDEYLVVDDVHDIIDELYEMDDDDFYVLMKFIEEKAIDSVINFAIPKHSCPHCGNTVEETALSVRDLLFIQRAHRLTE